MANICIFKVKYSLVILEKMIIHKSKEIIKKKIFYTLKNFSARQKKKKKRKKRYIRWRNSSQKLIFLDWKNPD